MTDHEKAKQAKIESLQERMLGLVGCAYAHARKACGSTEDSDRVEGSFMRSLLRRADRLHAEYAALLAPPAAAVPPKSPPPPPVPGSVPGPAQPPRR